MFKTKCESDFIAGEHRLRCDALHGIFMRENCVELADKWRKYSETPEDPLAAKGFVPVLTV